MNERGVLKKTGVGGGVWPLNTMEEGVSGRNRVRANKVRGVWEKTVLPPGRLDHKQPLSMRKKREDKTRRKRFAFRPKGKCVIHKKKQ